MQNMDIYRSDSGTTHYCFWFRKICFLGLLFVAGLSVAHASNDDRVRRGYLGVGVADITPQIQQKYHLQTRKGVVVGTVAKGSPAEQAGFEQLDVILQLNSDPIVSSYQFGSQIGFLGPGSAIRIKFMRGTKIYNTSVILGEDSSAGASPHPNAQADSSGSHQGDHETGNTVIFGDDPPDDGGELNLLGQGAGGPVRSAGQEEGDTSRLHRAQKGSLGKDAIIGRWQATKHHYNEIRRYGTYKGFTKRFMVFGRGGGNRLYIGKDGDFTFEVMNIQKEKQDAWIYTGKKYRSNAQPGSINMVDSFKMKITISAEGFVEMYYWGMFGIVYYKVH